MIWPRITRHLDTMIEFIAALAIFLASHSLPARPRLRARLVAWMGERLYLIAYALVSIAMLAWLILAARRAPYLELWPPSLAAYWAPLIVIPVALVLLIGGALAPNPLSVSLSHRAFRSSRPGLVAVTRHPLLWGLALWALSHVPPNGDLVSVILFGGLGLFALAAMPMIDRRRRRQLGAEWFDLARRTSTLPFAALLFGRANWRWPSLSLFWTFAAALLGFGVLLVLHAPIIGPDPLLVLH